MPKHDDIVSFSIHPAIAFARVGNSPDRYFLGPEVPGAGPCDADAFRDEQGRIKRQAVRFRIFGRNRRGEVVREITAPEAEITWTVHLANKKAAWFQFDQAFDIPASEGKIPGTPPLASALRNATIAGPDRAQLVIDPGPRTIQGTDVNSDGSDGAYAFDDGKFFGKNVYLGELRTDEEGRVIVLGGRGHSAPKDDQPIQPGQFANNDWWHDDTSDGPVEAVVRIDGREYQADGAWLVVAPPDYAPGIEAIVTGHDLVVEAATKLEPSLMPRRPSFAEHIYPLLARLVAQQWVNAGFFETFGWGSPLDFTRPDLLRRLNDPGEASLPLRHSILRRLRDPGSDHMQADAWPAIYGDAVELDNTKDADPLAWMPILATQYRWLAQWAAGDFDPVEPGPPKPWEGIPESERADALDRAALENTVGGPFHPGAEFTWPLRQIILYAAPFRIKRRQGPEPDWGTDLTSAVALAEGGPLDGSGPGDLTRWMACPWQTDTSSCLSAYRPYGGEYLPTFWPARVPNDVLTEAQYERIMSGAATIAVKQRAFDSTRRERWLRGVVYKNGTGFPAMRIVKPLPTAVFVDQWPHVGIVMRRPGPGMPDLFPEEFWVESGRSLDGRKHAPIRSSVPLCEIDPVELR